MFERFRRAPKVTVKILLKGRIGDGWMDVDTRLKVPPGTTLNELVAHAERRGIPLQHAIDNSPHLAHTLMINGSRYPIEEHGERVMEDGDQVALLAPLAGG